ncbi:uncharacterized protein PB18E9.04c-like [Sphaeramia orbicularis]|uniref:uncharacterized protein PB18E9.04c-like n=1 Tax=Sphaeramia orbicularis TaxID=375764 RepID=UPI00117D37BC|nr:uncharacterized protein PB18E9.04c-like [Sphaeramia orbicularis]
MKGKLFLSLAALMLFLPAVTGTHHLSFATNRSQVDITRNGCGTEKLCLDEPNGCDPTLNSSMCLFMSSDLIVLTSTNDSILTFELRGYSEGYIAMGLTMNASQPRAMIFACAQNSSNNGSFFFRTAMRTGVNDPPMPTERNTTEIRGVVNGNIIRCEFNVPDLNFTNINYTVLLGVGNVTEGSLDRFDVRLTRGPLNLTDPTRGSSNPTSPPPTTAPAPAPTTTPTPPLTITRDGCGTRKLCVETPGNCDPAGSGMCLFTSVVVSSPMPPNGVNLMIELRGDSQGYIALGLTSTASPETAMVFVCAQNSSNNGSFFFGTFQRNNTNPSAPLAAVDRTVSNTRGEVTGNVIRCVFTVPNVNSTARRRNADTTFAVLLGSGSISGGTIGTFNVALNRSLNLANPALGSSNPTTPAPTTTPTPALIIARTGCGTNKLCVETPGNCNPAGNSMCLFTSFIVNNSMPPNGVNLLIELRGDSEGYIALGLTSTASPETAMVFVCAQNSSNNGSFFFGTFQRNNTNPSAALAAVDRPVSNTRGEVTGNVIRCVFTVPNVNSTARRRNADTTFTVLLGSGSVNGSTLGTFNVALNRTLNLADPTQGSNDTQTTPAPSNVTTQVPPTTCGAESSYPHALLLLSVLVLSIMLRN